jgi:Ca-activated chloride channel family protein
MSFAAPLMLLALALVPAALVAYTIHGRRRERATAAFAARPVLPSAAPVRPGWRRHGPVAFYALAATLLVVSLARPEATVAVPDERASIILATDVSGSMQATDVRPTRLAAARAAAKGFLDDVPDDVRVGAMGFNHVPLALTPPTTDRAEVRQALDRLKPSGGTATGDALQAALDALEKGDRAPLEERAPAAIVLLSDGASTKGRDPLAVAREAKKAAIPVYTVALGTSNGTIPSADGGRDRVPPDRATMREVAQITGGQAFTAADRDRLSSVYEKLGSKVGTKKEQRELTAAFAGGALLLLALGGGTALRWFGRLP